jgi:hypothetical protein
VEVPHGDKRAARAPQAWDLSLLLEFAQRGMSAWSPRASLPPCQEEDEPAAAGRRNSVEADDRLPHYEWQPRAKLPRESAEARLAALRAAQRAKLSMQTDEVICEDGATCLVARCSAHPSILSLVLVVCGQPRSGGRSLRSNGQRRAEQSWWRHHGYRRESREAWPGRGGL